MATHALWIPGPVWAMNEMIAAAKGARGTGRIYSAKKKALTNMVAALAKSARIPRQTRVHIKFEFVERARNRDPDNLRASAKWLIDGLVVAGVLDNDGWDQIAGFADTWRVDKLRPGVLVTIIPA